MIELQKTTRIRTLLARLRDDTAGNVIALMAAAVVPTIGLVGGGLDMSRIYLVQTRLQAACDAGTLMGRRVMGANPWNHNSYKARTEAERIFNMNFENEAYGTEPVTKTFTEDSGNVSGTATTTVPMTLMRVLGSEEREITVTCASEMRIPDSDVMFVLDTTGSMDGTANGASITASNPRKIDGLKVATQCFYEILTQRNIPEVSATACGNTSDPSLTDSNISTIRFGFVPYSINVNVGRLLPLDYIADTWEYQSREPNHSNVNEYTYVLGTEGSKIQTTQTPGGTTGNYAYSSQNYVQGTKTFLKTVSGSKGLDCTKITLPTNVVTNNTNGPNQIAPAPATPVHPQASIRKYYRTIASTNTTAWRYVADRTPVSKNQKCYLQQRTDSNTITTNFYADTPLTWQNVQKKVFSNWTYDKVALDVSGLKDETNNAWNSSVSLPLRDSDDSSTSLVDERGTAKTISWDGCILERETVREPSSWYPIPLAAKDMDIDMLPDTSDPSTQWGPRLKDVLYERRTVDGSGNFGSKTLNPVNTTYSDMPGAPGNDTCPSPSRIYQTWDPTGFRGYVNGLSTDGYTFHDIGLLWGARLMSPNGIFSTHNGEGNDLIQRHMIFMTDGDTVANPDALTAYNLPYYDRLQTDVGSAPDQNDLDDLTNERAAALCTAIKNMNVTLWVVSYGQGVSSAANGRLATCASPGRFYIATSTAELTNNFKSIAAQISALRLTS
jgi:Flp pilus assembly protein TadG